MVEYEVLIFLAWFILYTAFAVVGTEYQYFELNFCDLEFEEIKPQ